MLVVVSYDIADDRRRTHAANAILDFGNRVQFSVFECVLSPEEIAVMAARLAKLIDGGEDSVRINPLCKACEKQARLLGLARPTVIPKAFIL